MTRFASERARKTRQGRDLHGRRKGRGLRTGQKRVLESLLPNLRIALPSEGETLEPRALFEEPRAVWLEIGFGAGEHLAWQAQRNPDVGILGAEIFRDGIAKLLRKVEESKLKNVRIHPGDARDFLDHLPARAVEKIFILFPDPWPKARHHKRRLIQQSQLDALARVLGDDGELRVATDDPGYQRWILTELSRHPAFEWTAQRPADWRERGSDWPATRYELKAIGEGRRPIYLRYRRRPRASSP